MPDWKIGGREYLEDNPICELCRKAQSQQVHHIFGRIGDNLFNKLNYIALCFKCHDRAEFRDVQATAFEIFEIKMRVKGWEDFALRQESRLFTEFYESYL